MSLFLVRHTVPDVAPGACYGRTDLPLRSSYQQDFVRVKQQLSDLTSGPELQIFCSPAQRCLQLAQFLFPQREILIDSRLQEMHFGEWEMQPWSDISRLHLDQWAADVTGFCPPGGESYSDLYRRCRTFAQQYLGQECLHPHAKSDRVVITHGGVIRSLLAFFLHQQQDEVRIGPGEPVEELTAMLAEPIEFGAVCRLAADTHTQRVSYTISPGDPRQPD